MAEITLLPTMMESCQATLKRFEQDCSGFIRAVAEDQRLFVPISPGQADDQLEFMELIGSAPRLFFRIGDGKSAEPDAVALARSGGFVVAGLTAAELNQNPTRKGHATSHGHVVLLTGEWGPTGWPKGYWGQWKGKPGYDKSLSACFREGDRPSIHYFAYLRGR